MRKSPKRDGQVITAWPTKLALAPALADQIIAMLDEPVHDADADAATTTDALADWPRPDVAPLPWEMTDHWTRELSDAPASN